MTTEQKALAACRQYDLWAREIRRLTDEIGSVVCPQEDVNVPEDDNGAPIDGPLFEFTEKTPGGSCFDLAKQRLQAKAQPDRWPTLRDIEREVAGCEACSRLCELIRARKHARQQWGVSKRRIRYIGRREAPHDD